jgi:hypothetical protein
MNKSAEHTEAAWMGKQAFGGKALPLSAAGVGLAALENRFIAPEMPEELKKVNYGIGGITGYMLASPDPKLRSMAMLGIPAKQMALFGIGAMDKLRRQQQSLVDANLAVAQVNKSTADVQRSQAEEAGRTALMFLLPALAAGGALGYMGYDKWKKKKSEIPRWQTTGGKGHSRSGQKIRIDVPATALPPEFFRSLTDVDDNARAFSRVMELSGGDPESTPKVASAEEKFSIPGLVGSLAYETTGIPSAQRTMKDLGSGAAAWNTDNIGEIGRYGSAAAANAALTLLAVRTGLLPIAGRLMGKRLVQHQAHGLPGVTNKRVIPNIAKAIDRWSYWGPGYSQRVARGVYDPSRYAWKAPTVNGFGSGLFKRFMAAPAGGATTVGGSLGNMARFAGNRAVNAGYWTKQLAKRHPIISTLALALPFAGRGTQRDEERQNEAKSWLANNWSPKWDQKKGPGGMPVSGVLSNVMGMFGAPDPRSKMRNEMQGGSFDPWFSAR